MEFIYGGLIPILGMLLGFGMVIVLIMVLTRSRQRRLELQSELQGKLIERFGSTPDLINFLQSPAGREFVMGVQQGPLKYTRERIISGFRRSIVLSALGAALTLLTLVDHDFLPFGVIVLFLGLGYFAATMVSMKLAHGLPADAAPGAPGYTRPPDSNSLTTNSEM